MVAGMMRLVVVAAAVLPMVCGFQGIRLGRGGPALVPRTGRVWSSPEESAEPVAAAAEPKRGPVPIAKKKEGPTPLASSPLADVATEEDEELTDEQKKARTLREQERFMVRDTGRMECSLCSYVYKEDEGDNRRLPPGTPWASVPENWRCPDCGAPKAAFQSSLVTIPGFEVNQGYGFGGNGMTGDQKTGLIFGGLVVFFLVFMSGYLLE